MARTSVLLCLTWLQSFFSCNNQSPEPLYKVAYYYSKIHRQVYVIDLEMTKYIGQYHHDSYALISGLNLSRKSGRLIASNPKQSAQYSEILSFDPVTREFDSDFAIPQFFDYPALSPDGSLLCGFSWNWDSVFSGPPRSIIVVDLDARIVLHTVSLAAFSSSLKFPQEIAVSPSGRFAAFVDPAASSAPLCLLDLVSGDMRVFPTDSGFPLSPTFTRDGQSCYFVDVNGRAVIRMDLASYSMTTVYEYDSDWVPDLQSVPNSDRLMMRYNTADRTSNRIVMFDKTGQVASQIDLPYSVSARSDFTNDSVLCLIAVPPWYKASDRYNSDVVGVLKQYTLIYFNVNTFTTRQMQLTAPQEMYYSDQFFVTWK